MEVELSSDSEVRYLGGVVSGGLSALLTLSALLPLTVIVFFKQ